MTTSRQLERLVNGRETADGAGVRLRRILTHDLQRRLDPFLMLDAFRSDNPDDYIGGFPDHPHRGFETITYMLAGTLEHRDNHGGHGLLQAGGVQWMTAGRGIVHSELPRQEHGLMAGFQLWLNLPARDKMCAPGYRDIGAAEIPVWQTPDGISGKVIAGTSRGVTGAMQRPVTEPLYVDLSLPAGTTLFHELPPEHNAFVFVHEGSVTVGGRDVQQGQMGILGAGAGTEGVELVAGLADTRVLLIAGRPLGEPIAQWGPFVMNTHEEIEATLRDFQNGRF